jgi:hypothetical protein
MAQARKASQANARWSEAIQRAGIIREYLRLDRPSVADADRAATALGVKRRNFYHLVQSFKERRHSDSPKRTPDTVEHLIDEMIRTMGPSASPSAITRAVQAAAKAQGLQPPAQKTVKLRVSAAALSALPPDRVIIDHAPLVATASINGERFIPYAIVAIAAGKGIVGLTVASSADPATLADVAFEAINAMKPLNVELEFVDPANADAIASHLRRTVVVSNRFTKAGSAISLLLMGRIGGIPIGLRLSNDALLAKTAHLPPAPMADIELHLRHELHLPLFVPGIRDLRDG